MAMPWMYNFMQICFGANRKKQILRQLLQFDQQFHIVLDIGGGTGLYQDFWPKNYQYICLDNDPIKLGGCKGSDGYSLCADAGQLPFKTNSVDYVFCSSMSHHIPEDSLEKIISEMHRVIQPSGTLIFMDAVSIPESRLNRFLWRLDRGEYPHSYETLEKMIGKYFNINILKRFSIYYDYLLVIALKLAVRAS